MGPGLLAFVVTILAMLSLRPVAVSIGLVDKPGGRKTHHGEIPITGGLAMLAGIAFGLGAVPGSLGSDFAFLLAASLLVFVGAIDDRFDLSPRIRLVAQVCAGLVMVMVAGYELVSLGNVLGTGEIVTGTFSSLLTITATVAAINAYNMMDGMDGLAGGLACVGLGTLAIAGIITGHSDSAVSLGIIVAAICGFLIFNLPAGFNRPLRSFMGDAGSTLLGFSIAWFGVKFSQGEDAAISPVTMLWVTTVPLMELFTSFIRRIRTGRSPFSADADHFHHMLVRAGFSVRATFLVLIGTELVFSVIGVSLMLLEVPEVLSLALLLLMTVPTSYSLFHAERMLRFIPVSLRRSFGQRFDVPVEAKDRG